MTWRCGASVTRFICAVSECKGGHRGHLPVLAVAGLLIPLVASFAIAAAGAQVDYTRDVQPLFDRYCVACHACFDAPCQLDLTHPTGVARGASKLPVYDGARLEAASPTRLFVDARSTGQWRQMGFFPVAEGGVEHALLPYVLGLSRGDDWKPGQSVADDFAIGITRANTCVADREEAKSTAAATAAHLGMPFALPPLAADDVGVLNRWVAQGAPMPTAKGSLPPADQAHVARWEAWLNRSEPARRLLARWLFEHWAIARLYFSDTGSEQFYRLVRSRTPPGEAIDEIATRHVDSDPGGPFFYRFQPQHGTRMFKTHITFALDESERARIDALFFASDWQLDRLPGYSDDERANPFITFAALPARARYRFMLEHAGYFVRTFIRGPVCRGQLATDVIRDQFWVMFQSPDSDPYITDAGYRDRVDELLALPGVDLDLLDGARQWIESTKARNRYVALRDEMLAATQPEGAALAHIWNGDRSNPNALLSIFRHHDSASLIRGWLGRLPLTAWWMDFPLFERSYYNLVVNFDVFGNVAHQAQTRLYFDLIRNGAEQNFLRLLPPQQRQTILDEWYAGSGKLKMWLSYHAIDTDRPSAVDYASADAKHELLTRLLRRFSPVNATPDALNRTPEKLTDPVDTALARLAGVPAARMPAILELPEASVLRVVLSDRSRRMYTVLRNRHHSNVAFVLGESLRYEPDKDTLTIVPGIATAHPNYMFDVPAPEVGAFVAALSDEQHEGRDEYLRAVVERWGVRRSAPQFWDLFHDIHSYLRETDPTEAAQLDLNRYLGD